MQIPLILKTKSQNHLYLNVKKSVFVIFMCVFVSSYGQQVSLDRIDDITYVKLAMQEQENAWNEGDLIGFMKHYWESDSLRFIGKSGLNHGWEKTLSNYKKSYKNKAEMGILKFNNKSVEILGEETIFVVGKWHLKREDSLGDLEGMYSLIWQKKNGQWVITTDHSS